MQSQNKFSLLRSILRALGLSQEAADDIVDRVLDFLSGDNAKDQEAKYPYALRDDFLSPAELNFYRVLASVVSPDLTICTKVSLGDLFYAKTQDASAWRIYTNKIDRKHVDFLLCNSQTMRPQAGIELDDSSHRRADRQSRDEFVNRVFETAGLPLLRVPAKRSYASNELCMLIERQLNIGNAATNLAKVTPPDALEHMKALNSEPRTTKQIDEVTEMSPSPQSLPGVSLFTMVLPVKTEPLPPKCPKCGSEMVLRTARSGTNRGGKFWGCSNYPKCHGIVNCESS
jgi:predicted RNA-binding Zn-ribbon protein involved in translation (DUF1610 family)